MGKKTPQDPTGQGVNRRKSKKRLQNRLEKAKREIKALFREIPKRRRTQVKIVNQDQVIYDYDLTPEQREIFEAEVRRILDEDLETQGDRVPPEWFWKQDVELPYRQGTTEELVQFNQMISAAVVAGVLVRGLPPQRVAPELVLFSQPYLEALNNAYVSNYSVIKTLSSRTASQVIQTVNLGIQAGNTPTDIAVAINGRFDVAVSSAERIARTEVNKAYNDARMNAVEIAADQSGLRAGVLHISALTPTTRDTHAARHGLAYTTAQQMEWWNTGSNRINCLCTTRSVLIDNNGKVVQKEEQEDIREEGKQFFKK